MTDLPTIHCICGIIYSQHMHTVCPKCHRWPSASAAEWALMVKRAELAARLAQREAITVTREADPVDDGLQLAAREVATMDMERMRELLRQVEAALVRIRDGSWGICASCDEPISVKRLAAVPWAEMCVECAGRVEQERAAVAAAGEVR